MANVTVTVNRRGDYVNHMHEHAVMLHSFQLRPPFAHSCIPHCDRDQLPSSLTLSICLHVAALYEFDISASKRVSLLVALSLAKLSYLELALTLTLIRSTSLSRTRSSTYRAWR